MRLGEGEEHAWCKFHFHIRGHKDFFQHISWPGIDATTKQLAFPQRTRGLSVCFLLLEGGGRK